MLLCSATLLAAICIAAAGALAVWKTYLNEKVRLTHNAAVSVEAFEQHTALVVEQIDVLLHGVRMTYQRTGSAAETRKYIDGLELDNSTIENIFLVRPDGSFIIPGEEKYRTKSVVERDYYRYHSGETRDNLFISGVEKGVVSGRYRFRISRRISGDGGSFRGIVLATVNPESLNRYYRYTKIGPQSIAVLVGTLDRKIRARVPESDPRLWGTPIDSSLFDSVVTSREGVFNYTSPIDSIPRVVRYKKVEDLPLVMIVGFSESDIWLRISERRNWILVVTATSIIFIVSIAAVFLVIIRKNELLRADIIERTRFEEEIRRQLAEKELLLRETHHRMKNNIASIGGLLSLHKDDAASPEAALVLQDAIGRVNSMKVLYENLMASDDYREIPAGIYLNDLVDSVISLFTGSAHVTVEKELGEFSLPSRLLFPLGIIVNELLTNAMKYAFAGREEGVISISTRKEGGRITLAIRDNGAGLPDGFDIGKSTGFGLTLVKMLCKQISASLSVESSGGTRTVIAFPA
jgi:two-component sensor histidine kinase